MSYPLFNYRCISRDLIAPHGGGGAITAVISRPVKFASSHAETAVASTVFLFGSV